MGGLFRLVGSNPTLSVHEAISRLSICEDCLVSDDRAQAHLDAPLDEVWALVGNPATYLGGGRSPWRFAARRSRLGTRIPRSCLVSPDGGSSTRRTIDRRDEFKELKWSCPTTGGFQHWTLTAADGGTFVDMEMGLNPPTLRYTLFDKSVGRWFMKRWAEQAVDGLRQTLTSAGSSGVQSAAQSPDAEIPQSGT